MASSLPAVQLSPDCLAAIVQAVRASIVAKAVPGSLLQSSSLPASVTVVGTSCSSPPVLGGIPGQDLGTQASALLASGTGFSLQSPLASTSSSQGRPAFVVLSFISTFVPPNPSLVSSRACSVAAFSIQSVVLIQRQFFVNHLWSARDSCRSQQKSSRRLCPKNLWSLTSFFLPTLCLQSQNHNCCLMGA